MIKMKKSTGLKKLTVKEQASAITILVSKFLKDLGFEDWGSDNGRDIHFELKGGNDDDHITFYKGYFGANSDPYVIAGPGYSNAELSKALIEAEEQITVYLDEIKESIL